MWFRQVFGFEENADSVRRQLRVDGDELVSAANGRRFTVGRLRTPSLAELRRTHVPRAGSPSIRECVGNVWELHADPVQAGALFQVASQFNLLEMPSPDVTPESGIDGYEHDRTQGPVCAMAAAGATVVRNWFVPVDGHVGQTADRQLDMLADVGALLNHDGALWRMQNGYALFDPACGDRMAERMAGLDPDVVRRALRVGIHESVGVTVPGAAHTVSQVFCSALPLAYMRTPSEPVRALARLVLQATYEATLLLAARSDSDRVFLTLVGGGVFGNDPRWILDAIERAVALPGLGPLDVAVVSYGQSQPGVAALADRASRGR